ncbi:MAG: hypothetical protein KBB83_06690 [Alphaproteobacteria bacterium]|nr:hypothetical protein [Alphaproteobacteria bacterium]
MNAIEKLIELRKRMDKRGFPSHYFVNDIQKIIQELENPWRPITDHKAKYKELCDSGAMMWGLMTNRGWEQYHLSVDDEGSMRTADDYADFFSDWEYEDFTHYMPLPAPLTCKGSLQVQPSESEEV